MWRNAARWPALRRGARSPEPRGAFGHTRRRLTDSSVQQGLRPGQTATFANYTSYRRGTNGIVVDIARLPAAARLTAADFEFRAG